MKLLVTHRNGSRLLAAVLACVLLMLGSGPAAAGQRLHPPRTVEEGAWWYDVMRIAQAHKTSTGKGATIALIDSGIDPSVPELRGADIRLRYDCREKRARPLTGPHAAHGTTQAALLVGNGRGNGANGAGVRGIAPDATILAYDDDLRPEQPHIQCPSEAFDRMFDDAIRQGADVISVAATLGAYIVPAVRRALDAGVVVVAAAGADDVSSGVFPSDMPGVVSVYAVDRFARPWNHQRTHGVPVISAPGVFVGAGGIFDSGWLSNAWVTGTSPATTITSGALALVKARYPKATGNQLLQQLIHHTGGDGPYAWDGKYGFGIVSVMEMLATSPTQWPDENPLGKHVPEALTKYPMSASTLVEDGASPAPSTKGSRRGVDAGAARASGHGVPGWTWLAGALVLAAAAAGALMTRRGRRTTPRVADETRGA